MKKVIIIIPAFNEEHNILETVKDIKINCDFADVVVINDASKDNTLQICSDNSINYINLIHNLGIGGAVQTGYKYALLNDYDIAIQFDGDGQHDAKYIKKLIEPIITGKSDFVIGSRFIGNLSKFKSTPIRRIGIKIISYLIKIFTKRKITDPTSGFRASNKQIIKLFAEYYPSEYPEPESTITLLKKGFIIKEIPVEMRERKSGISSIRSWKNVYYMVNVCLAIIINSLKRGGK